MVTMSVNPNVYKPMIKVTKLNLNPTKQIEQEWLSEAYIKIIEGKKDKRSYELSAYAAMCERNNQYARSKKGDVAIVDDKDMLAGYTVLAPEDTTAESYFDKVERNADAAYYVIQFKDMREYILLERKNDIWRLLQLSLQNDKKAQSRLRQIAEDDTFFGIRELLEQVIKTPRCLDILFADLGRDCT